MLFAKTNHTFNRLDSTLGHAGHDLLEVGVRSVPAISRRTSSRHRSSDITRSGRLRSAASRLKRATASSRVASCGGSVRAS